MKIFTFHETFSRPPSLLHTSCNPVVEKVITETKIREVNKGKEKKQYNDQKIIYSANQLSLCQV